MTRTKPFVWLTALALFLALAESIVTDAGGAGVGPAQAAEKTLDIERYPNEPLELVDINIGVQSVKNRIKIKSRHAITKWGRDTVKFIEKDGWFKHVNVKLKNVSGRPITGLRAYLYFRSAAPKKLFRLPLERSKDLRREALQPGAEIDLVVNDQLLSEIVKIVKQSGADAEATSVTFSAEGVLFGDDTQWYRGQMLRRDPDNPESWKPVSMRLPEVVGESGRQVQFTKATFKSAVARPQSLDQCVTENGFIGDSCPENSFCKTLFELGNPGGLLSRESVGGICEQVPGVEHGGITCTSSTTHSRLEPDSNCEPCPDADGDGYTAQSCGGSDCIDTNPNINPGATENCSDTVDNDCNGLADDLDVCACGGYEGPNYIAGGEVDCGLCNDGDDNDCDDDIDGADGGCYMCLGSPVLVDVAGNGFNLTDAANGVNFDLNSDGTTERLSWTAPQADDAWLALDRNGNGTINNGSELFGNFTPQPEPPVGVVRNGFNALAVYDGAAQGGNGDGLITKQDAIFASLRLWQDANHNGFSEASELRTLNQLGLKSIDLDYKESRRRDEHGNWFRYRAKVKDTRDAQLGRWAWDVFLVNGSSASAKSTVRPQPLFRSWVLSSTTPTGYTFGALMMTTATVSGCKGAF